MFSKMATSLKNYSEVLRTIGWETLVKYAVVIFFLQRLVVSRLYAFNFLLFALQLVTFTLASYAWLFLAQNDVKC